MNDCLQEVPCSPPRKVLFKISIPPCSTEADGERSIIGRSTGDRTSIDDAGTDQRRAIAVHGGSSQECERKQKAISRRLVDKVETTSHDSLFIRLCSVETARCEQEQRATRPMRWPDSYLACYGETSRRTNISDDDD